jgi:hypothetical protein
MNLETIKTVLQNKITALNTRRQHHFQEGDLDIVAGLDTEISETQDTLNQLNSIGE